MCVPRRATMRGRKYSEMEFILSQNDEKKELFHFFCQYYRGWGFHFGNSATMATLAQTEWKAASIEVGFYSIRL